MITGGTKMLKSCHSFLMKHGDNLKAIDLLNFLKNRACLEQLINS